MQRLALTGLLPVLFVASGAAQTSPVVTEAEFLSALDDSHPAVVETAEAVAVARAGVVAATTLENPVLGGVREDPGGSVEQTDWTISWQLPESSRRPRIDARNRGVEAAAARASQELWSLRLRMREVYARWALASARRELLSAQAAGLEALAARAATRADRGEASGLEAHRLTLAAAGLRARVGLAGAAAEEARASARSWHPGLPADAEPALPSPLPTPPQLEEAHPLERAAQAELDAAVLERRAAGRFLRTPELVVGWQRQEAGPAALDGPILGFAWSLPLFGRNQAGLAVAEARASAARARLERVADELRARRTAALETYRLLLAALAEHDAALAGNERMLRGAEAAFRYGEASLTDLLETQRSVTEAELAALDLHEAALAAHRELERLAGPGSASSPSVDPPREEPLP